MILVICDICLTPTPDGVYQALQVTGGKTFHVGQYCCSRKSFIVPEWARPSKDGENLPSRPKISVIVGDFVRYEVNPKSSGSSRNAMERGAGTAERVHVLDSE